jgi:hypothetical protein
MYPTDIALAFLFGALLWCVLALRDRAYDLAALAADDPDTYAIDTAAGRDERDRFNDRRRQAVIVVQWCRERLKCGLEHDVNPPAVGKLVAGWCSMLDNVEICGIDIIGADALAQHFVGNNVPGFPPLVVTDFDLHRRRHAYERRQIRDEIEARNAVRQSERILAVQREREGKGSGGGPRLKAGEIPPARGLA